MDFSPRIKLLFGHLDSYPAGNKELIRQEKDINQAEKIHQQITQESTKYDSKEVNENSDASSYDPTVVAQYKRELVGVSAADYASKSAQAELYFTEEVSEIIKNIERITPILPYQPQTEKPRPQMQFFYQPYTAEEI